MQLINKSDLLAPGVCVLCEGSPADEHKIVDTLKNLVTGFPFQLQGRKYVCQPCIEAVAAVIGLTSAEAQVEAERKLAEAEAKLTAVGGFLDGLADEIRAGKFADVVQHAEVPAEEIKSGLEASIEAGVDPGAVSIEGAAAPIEADAQPVTAAEIDATRVEDAPESFDPSLTEAPKQNKESKAKAPKPKTKEEIAAENPPIAAEIDAVQEPIRNAAQAAKDAEKEAS